ncbi:MAG: DUF2760 domain-containing protein [Myxococcota bacterium]|nr:DUF2760 domain-containing protein [Myxococcota bacterium]
MAIDDDTIPLSTRLWLAWRCLFRVLFDAGFAVRVWRLQDATGTPATAALAASAAAAPEGSMTSALQLLALLQQEGRLVDFLQQDIAAFHDSEVGVAARVVHEGCRRALRDHARIEPLRSEVEGAPVEIASGFDADEVKLVGDVRGTPPYAGVLRHRGWRAAKLELPLVVGRHDLHVLAPAEVELG